MSLITRLKDWMAPPLPEWAPPPAGARLIQTLREDRGQGLAEVAWGELATGWTLQIGSVAYDWHGPSATLYRQGSVYLRDFEKAECFEDSYRPGVWTLRGQLDGKTFEHTFTAMCVSDWPLHRSMALEYWCHCFFLEAQRAGSWKHAPCNLGFVADKIHNICVGGGVLPLGKGEWVVTIGTRQGKGLVSRPFSEEEWSSLNYLDILSPESPLQNAVREAILLTPASASNVRDYFWRYLCSRANQQACRT